MKGKSIVVCKKCSKIDIDYLKKDKDLKIKIGCVGKCGKKAKPYMAKVEGKFIHADSQEKLVQMAKSYNKKDKKKDKKDKKDKDKENKPNK